MVRNILAVLAGFAVWTVLWLASNAAVAAAVPSAFGEDGSTTNAGILVLFLVLSVVFSITAGYLCAMLAREKPRRLAWVLGVLLLAVGIAVQIQFWGVMPIWYHLLFLALLIPGVLFGAKIRLGRARQVVYG